MIHLEIEDGEVLADHRGIEVLIPLEIGENIRPFQGVELPYPNASDDDFGQEAKVAAKRRRLDGSWLGQLCSFFVFGSAEDPYEVQVERGVASLQHTNTNSRAPVEWPRSFSAACEPPRSFSPDLEESRR